MKRLVLALSLTIAFLVGCLTATVATKFVVPPIKAGTNPQKWEYHCFYLDDVGKKGNQNEYKTVETFAIDDFNEYMNKLGSEGWEQTTVGSQNASYAKVDIERTSLRSEFELRLIEK